VGVSSDDGGRLQFLEFIEILAADDLGPGRHVVCVSLGKLATFCGFSDLGRGRDEQGFVATQN